MAEKEVALPVMTFRVVNVEDAVTTMPIPAFGKLTYQHVDTPICNSAHCCEKFQPL